MKLPRRCPHTSPTHRRRDIGAVLILTLGLLALAPTMTASAWPPPSYVEPLREIGLRGGHLGWDGVYVGMTFAEVERSVGRVGAPDPEPGMLCPLHRTELTVDGQRLGLDFSGTGDDAVLRAITILLEPRIGERFETAAVVDALRDRLDLDFVPSPHAPRLAEAAVEKPLYRTRNDELVFVNPEAGVAIGAVCVD